MRKKILFSLLAIAISAAAVIGGTTAFFSDTETSTGNVFTAGSIDLKVDHTKQTYNDIDCKTCSVLLVSDPTNLVVAKNGNPLTPYPAVYLNPIHSAWTAQNDPSLVAANAKWIWEQNPVKQEDTTVDVTYTFEKTFEWWGPITGSDLSMAVGHDNTVDVYLNNILIGQGTNIYGFQQENMLHIPAANIIANTVQGINILKFVVKNVGQSNGNPSRNPAGLIYKFEINGNCGDDYFRNNCRLWGLKDLVPGDVFWNFDDIKPGDRGTNVISLHVYDNDGYACLLGHNIVDDENGQTDPEIKAGDITPALGELSQFIKIFAWVDDGDGLYNIGDQIITGPNSLFSTPIGVINLLASQTKYIGLAWCAGTQTVDGQGVINCDGSTMGDIAQTDKMTADFTAYAEQQRNNDNFSCPDWNQGN